VVNECRLRKRASFRWSESYSFPRNGSNDEQWTLDVASGNILEFLGGPAKGKGAPEDSNADLTGGKLRTLNRSEVTSITPHGFEPLVLTDRFLFANVVD